MRLAVILPLSSQSAGIPHTRFKPAALPGARPTPITTCAEVVHERYASDPCLHILIHGAGAFLLGLFCLETDALVGLALGYVLPALCVTVVQLTASQARTHLTRVTAQICDVLIPLTKS